MDDENMYIYPDASLIFEKNEHQIVSNQIFLSWQLGLGIDTRNNY